MTVSAHAIGKAEKLLAAGLSCKEVARKLRGEVSLSTVMGVFRGSRRLKRPQARERRCACGFIVTRRPCLFCALAELAAQGKLFPVWPDPAETTRLDLAAEDLTRYLEIRATRDQMDRETRAEMDAIAWREAAIVADEAVRVYRDPERGVVAEN